MLSIFIIFYFFKEWRHRGDGGCFKESGNLLGEQGLQGVDDLCCEDVFYLGYLIVDLGYIGYNIMKWLIQYNNTSEYK